MRLGFGADLGVTVDAVEKDEPGAEIFTRANQGLVLSVASKSVHKNIRNARTDAGEAFFRKGQRPETLPNTGITGDSVSGLRS